MRWPLPLSLSVPFWGEIGSDGVGLVVVVVEEEEELEADFFGVNERNG